MNLMILILLVIFTGVESWYGRVMSTVQQPAQITFENSVPFQPAINPKTNEPIPSAMKKEPREPNRKPTVTLDEATLIIRKTREDSHSYTLNWKNEFRDIRYYVIETVLYEKPDAKPVIIDNPPYYWSAIQQVKLKKFGRYVITVKGYNEQDNVIHWGQETIEVEFRVVSNRLVVKKGALIAFRWEKPPIDVEYQIRLEYFKSDKAKGKLIGEAKHWKKESYDCTAKNGVYEITVSFEYGEGVISDTNSVYATDKEPTMEFITNGYHLDGMTVKRSQTKFIEWKTVKKAKRYFVQVLHFERHVKDGYVVGTGPKNKSVRFPFGMEEVGRYTILVVALTDDEKTVTWGKASFLLSNQ